MMTLTSENPKHEQRLRDIVIGSAHEAALATRDTSEAWRWA